MRTVSAVRHGGLPLLALLIACGNPPVTANNLPTGDVADDGDVAVTADVTATDATVDVASDSAADVPADVSESQCPNTAMQILEGQAVVPQTLLHLKCDAGYGPDVAKCVWSIKQPSGATSQVQAGNSANDAVFTPNLAGEYTFCPFATYKNGVMDCAIPCQTVLVLPDQAVHGELMWDTPGAATLTDAAPCKSAHPELHFAHDYAMTSLDLDCDGVPDPWFDPKYDCSPHNPNPDWGSADPNIDDDPHLDAFDAGPQNLNLGLPEDGKSYRVGVFNGATCGPSNATVRIYIYGQLVFEAGKSLKVFNMWRVATLTWPDGDVQGCHDSQCAKTGTGPCITPCYKPPAGLSIPGEWTSTACPLTLRALLDQRLQKVLARPVARPHQRP